MIPESPAFHAYIAPAANGRGSWWRVLAGILLIAACTIGWGTGLGTLVLAGALSGIGIGAEALDISGRNLSPAGIVVFLLTFAGVWIGLWAALRLVHGRGFGTLFGPAGRPATRNLLKGAMLALAFHAVTLATWSAVVGPPERTALPFDIWALWIAPVVAGVLVQATSEELAFRGYLAQHFAAWSRNPLVWAVAPTLIFTALHYDGEMEPGLLWRMLVHITVFGLIAALTVWRTGGLGAAIGLHVANNIVAIGGIGIEGAGFGFELALFGAGTLERMFAFDMALSALMAAAVLILFRPERAA